MDYATSSRCVVRGCDSEIGDMGLYFHRIPVNIDKRKYWLTRLEREDLIRTALYSTSMIVCSRHFSKDMYRQDNGKHLRADAFPNQNIELPEPKPDIDYLNNQFSIGLPNQDIEEFEAKPDLEFLNSQFQIQTTFPNQNIEEFEAKPDLEFLNSQFQIQTAFPNQNIEEFEAKPDINLLNIQCSTYQGNLPEVVPGNSTSSICTIAEIEGRSKTTQTETSTIIPYLVVKNYRIKIASLKKNISRIRARNRVLTKERKNLLSEAQIYETFSPDMANMIIDVLRNGNKKKRGKRYSEEVKHFASQIYAISPLAYDFLAEAIELPSKGTLKRHVPKEG